MLDLDLKKNARQVLSVLLALAVVAIGVSVIANLSGRRSPIGGLDVIGPQPVKIDQTYNVKPKQMLLVPLEVTYAPARFHGDWLSRRPVKEGLTNDLVSFQILSPGNEKLYVKNSDSFGKFDVTLMVTGKYTIALDNGGFLRETPREVRVEATLEPR